MVTVSSDGLFTQINKYMHKHRIYAHAHYITQILYSRSVALLRVHRDSERASEWDRSNCWCISRLHFTSYFIFTFVFFGNFPPLNLLRSWFVATYITYDYIRRWCRADSFIIVHLRPNTHTHTQTITYTHVRMFTFRVHFHKTGHWTRILERYTFIYGNVYTYE